MDVFRFHTQHFWGPVIATVISATNVALTSKQFFMLFAVEGHPVFQWPPILLAVFQLQEPTATPITSLASATCDRLLR
jgi:hypothetical protein